MHDSRTLIIGGGEILTIAREESIDDGSRMQPGTGMHSHSLRFIYDKDRFILIDDRERKVLSLQTFEDLLVVLKHNGIAGFHLGALPNASSIEENDC